MTVQRTHHSACWQHHLECALAKIERLKEALRIHGDHLTEPMCRSFSFYDDVTDPEDEHCDCGLRAALKED